MRERFEKGGTGYGDFKKQLFERLWEHFQPMRKRREELLADKLYVDELLVRGARRANEVANEVMTRVRAAVGLDCEGGSAAPPGDAKTNAREARHY